MHGTQVGAFIDPDDRITTMLTSNFGVVSIRGEGNLDLFAKDPADLDRLAEACTAAAVALRSQLEPVKAVA